MDETARTEIEAAAFRRLVEHLQERTDVQNIDLMDLAGFCRNCLSRWYLEAADERGIPLAGLVYLVWPWTFRSQWFQHGPARWWGFEPFVADIGRAPVGRVWLEGVFTLAFQIAMIWALDLSLLGWLACYWAFGINWSSVQYSDHAGSPRDVVEGAWNLRFWPVTQALFLNYNLHLAHHRQPGIPWIHLPRLVRKGDPNPSFWPIYLGLFRGARPAPTGPGPEPLPTDNTRTSNLA